MKVYRSNRVEQLLLALQDAVRTPAGDPFAAETIVVHSRAMAVWLSMRLSERFGAWVGGAFPFPRRFMHDVLTDVLGAERAGTDAWASARLAWAVLAELPRHLRDPAFEPLRRYLDRDPRDHGRFELARRIADVFDQYAVYRPDLVRSWEAGRDEDWQARLWRALVERIGNRHPTTLAREFFSALGSGHALGAHVPARVCVFGISSLPPLYLRMFAALGERIDVHMFVLSPSREYWAEIRSQREALRAARREPDRVAAPMLGGQDEGNPLLASFGGVGRDFQRVLEAEVDYVEPPGDLYRDPARTDMLGVLQADILHLRRRAAERKDAAAAGLGPRALPPVPLSPDDHSIQIHACHSPMREVEVLHDQLMQLLHVEGVAPHDILVMTPNMEQYGPLIEAVFERGSTSDPRFIPYTIADRTPRRESPVLEGLLRVLSMVDGRVAASSVLDLLSLEVVQRRFGIDGSEHDTIADWVADAGIRWGVDADHRVEHDQPRYEQNTWEFGLRRMLLGYALPSDGYTTFAGVLPFDEVEGGDALVLGKLAQFLRTLFIELEDLGRPRTPAGWADRIGRTLDALLSADGDTAWEHQQIRAALEEVATDASAVRFDDTIDVRTIHERLQYRIEQDRPARGLMAGGVTFCALLPMRTLPFSVVGLLGMSDGEFPRAPTRVGFDRIAAEPRAGDRSRRADDRYLFLEALLSARSRIVATYVGCSITDNAALPPSVAIAELLDVLASTFVPTGLSADASAAARMRAITDHVVVRHAMQPFSPRYFPIAGDADDGRLFSFAAAWEDGARAIAGRGDATSAAPLLLQPLPAPSGDRQVTVDDLVRTLSHPCAQLLKRRLGINLTDYGRNHEDREPTELDGLQLWKIGDAVLDMRMQKVSLTRVRDVLTARGELPLGVLGQARFDAVAAEVEPIVSTTQGLRGPAPRPDVAVDLDVDGTRLLGRIGDRWTNAVVIAQYAKVGPKHQLAAWIRHLVLSSIVDEPVVTAVIGKPERSGGAQLCQLQPVQDPQRLLADLVRLYWIAQREPVPLFVRSSCAYVEALPGGEAEALSAAHRPWTDRVNPEGGDPHVQRLFGGDDPLQPGYSPLPTPLTAGDFPTVSVAVFGPLLQHRKEH